MECPGGQLPVLDEEPLRGREGHGERMLRHRFGERTAVTCDREIRRQGLQRDKIDPSRVNCTSRTVPMSASSSWVNSFAVFCAKMTAARRSTSARSAASTSLKYMMSAASPIASQTTHRPPLSTSNNTTKRGVFTSSSQLHQALLQALTTS
jgi:hypothetical protein